MNARAFLEADNQIGLQEETISVLGHMNLLYYLLITVKDI